MKVLVVAQQLRRPVPGGIGTYVTGLLQGLAQMGGEQPDVSLLASRPPAAPDPLSSHGRPVLASPLPGPALTRLWDVGLAAAPAGFDVVHATSFAAPPVRRAPMAAMVHDLAWREVPDAFPARGRRWHERAFGRISSAAERVVVPSRRGADLVVASGVPAGKVVVIEEGCDHLPPSDRAAADRLLASLGVDGPYLLTVSTLEPRKNLASLVEAYSMARTRLPEPWPLVVVGPSGWGGAHGSGGVAIREAKGVVAAGFVGGATLAALYAGARCFAYVPLVEGFGLPPVEAMHAAVPVVASPMPSTAGAALEVDPRSPAAIADALVAAAGDERERSRLVTAGLLRAAELTWRRTAEQHVDMWRDMA